MIEIIRAPDVYPGNFYSKATIFLAGSIEMGAADDWQRKVIEGIKDEDAIIFNPRRLMWDASWEQSIDNPPFREQVMWELTHLNRADIRFFYFEPNTKSPISLLEFGIAVSSFSTPPIVVCPDGFWRKGNVDVTAAFYDETWVYDSLEDGIQQLKDTIKDVNKTLEFGQFDAAPPDDFELSPLPKWLS